MERLKRLYLLFYSKFNMQIMYRIHGIQRMQLHLIYIFHWYILLFSGLLLWLRIWPSSYVVPRRIILTNGEGVTAVTHNLGTPDPFCCAPYDLCVVCTVRPRARVVVVVIPLLLRHPWSHHISCAPSPSFPPKDVLSVSIPESFSAIKFFFQSLIDVETHIHTRVNVWESSLSDAD